MSNNYSGTGNRPAVSGIRVSRTKLGGQDSNLDSTVQSRVAYR